VHVYLAEAPPPAEQESIGADWQEAQLESVHEYIVPADTAATTAKRATTKRIRMVDREE